MTSQTPFQRAQVCFDCVIVVYVNGLTVYRQQDLFRVLKAYTLYRPEEGYCQAQAPIAAVLLMHMPAEVIISSHTNTMYSWCECTVTLSW